MHLTLKTSSNRQCCHGIKSLYRYQGTQCQYPIVHEPVSISISVTNAKTTQARSAKTDARATTLSGHHCIIKAAHHHGASGLRHECLQVPHQQHSQTHCHAQITCCELYCTANTNYLHSKHTSTSLLHAQHWASLSCPSSGPECNPAERKMRPACKICSFVLHLGASCIIKTVHTDKFCRPSAANSSAPKRKKGA